MSSKSGGKDGKTDCKILQSVNVKVFTFNNLKAATRNFHADRVLGEGGFGPVYKGWIDENTLLPCKSGTGITVAVKKLNHDGWQGHQEWTTEVCYLGKLCHPNIVKLIGYCIEHEHRLLVYEFMRHGSLDNHLFRNVGGCTLPWNLRMKVALGAAKGLAYLHSADVKVISRTFKASDILLDRDYSAKLSDFGFAKDFPVGEMSYVSTRVIGTYGYAAPEYVSTGHLTAKCDIYSFGVVLLEMLSGRRVIDKRRPHHEQSLVDWARPYLTDKRMIYRILDARLEGQYNLKCAQNIAALAHKCLYSQPKERPTMDDVVTILQELEDFGEAKHQEPEAATLAPAAVSASKSSPKHYTTPELSSPKHYTTPELVLDDLVL